MKLLRRTALLATFLVTVTVSGCGGKSDTSTSASGGSGGRVLTAADLQKLPPNSPELAAMTLWYQGEVGDVVDMVSLYAPEVRKVVGSTVMAGAFGQQRSFFSVVYPTVLSTRPTERGTLVTIKGTPPKGAPAIDSFLLKKINGTWTILYDTLLDRSLVSFIQSQVDVVPRPTPSNKALQAGMAASQQYRSVFLEPASALKPAEGGTPPPAKTAPAKSKKSSTSTTPAPKSSKSTSTTTTTTP